MAGEILVDSSAAIGRVHRKGNGKLRHVRVGMLWIQEQVEEGEIKVKKVKGDDNPADLFTKNLAETKVAKFMDMIGELYIEGRAEAGLKLK